MVGQAVFQILLLPLPNALSDTALEHLHGHWHSIRNYFNCFWVPRLSLGGTETSLVQGCRTLSQEEPRKDRYRRCGTARLVSVSPMFCNSISNCQLSSHEPAAPNRDETALPGLIDSKRVMRDFRGSACDAELATLIF